MSAHPHAVARYGGRPLEHGFVHGEKTAIGSLFAAMARESESREADAPLIASREARAREIAQEAAEAAAWDMRPRAPEILARKEAQERAERPVPGTAVARAFQKAKARRAKR